MVSLVKWVLTLVGKGRIVGVFLFGGIWCWFEIFVFDFMVFMIVII